jgi:alkylhydroperoxidase/carboxymuconolactone decarboxylase family protein YurZ
MMDYMSTGQDDPSSLEGLIGDAAVSSALRRASPTTYAAAETYLQAPMDTAELSPRLRELLLLAMHGSCTTLNVAAVERQIRRARQVGASDADILDVLLTISAVANHALYFSVPILVEELEAAGREVAEPPGAADVLERLKQDFLAARGFWNEDRDRVARLMPEYFAGLHAVSTTTWKTGSLTDQEREFVCIAIDCTVTHTYEPGLRLHVRNALRRGATQNEILAIFQLAALFGLEGYRLGAHVLFGDQRD